MNTVRRLAPPVVVGLLLGSTVGLIGWSLGVPITWAFAADVALGVPIGIVMSRRWRAR